MKNCLGITWSLLTTSGVPISVKPSSSNLTSTTSIGKFALSIFTTFLDFFLVYSPTFIELISSIFSLVSSISLRSSISSKSESCYP